MTEGKVRVETLANGMRLVHTSSEDPVTVIHRTAHGYVAYLPSISNLERTIGQTAEGKITLRAYEIIENESLPHVATYRKQNEFWIRENGITFDVDDPGRALRIAPYRLGPEDPEAQIMDIILELNNPK